MFADPGALSPPGAAADPGGVCYVPRGLLPARALPGRGRGDRRGRVRGGATPNHIGVAWEDSLLRGRMGAVNPESPAGEPGWGTCISRGVGVLTRRKTGSPGLTPWEGHAGRGRVGGTPELHIVVGVDDNLALLPSTSLGGELWVGGTASPDFLQFSEKEGFPRPRALSPPPLRPFPPGSPYQYRGGSASPGSPPPAQRGEGALCSRPRLRPESGHAAPPAPGSLPRGASAGPGGVGGRVSLAGRGRGPGDCWEGRGAAGQAGKSHTRSGSGDAPAAPLLRLDLAADSGPRICIFWHPVERERRTEPTAFKGAAHAVASPREAV